MYLCILRIVYAMSKGGKLVSHTSVLTKASGQLRGSIIIIDKLSALGIDPVSPCALPKAIQKGLIYTCYQYNTVCVQISLKNHQNKDIFGLLRSITCDNQVDHYQISV